MDNYDRIEKVLKNNNNIFLQCFDVWVDVNKYFDEPSPTKWSEFFDKFSLINCVIENSQYTQHLFDFEL